MGEAKGRWECLFFPFFLFVWGRSTGASGGMGGGRGGPATFERPSGSIDLHSMTSTGVELSCILSMALSESLCKGIWVLRALLDLAAFAFGCAGAVEEDSVVTCTRSK